MCVSVYTRLEAVCRQCVDTSADTFRVQKKVLEPMKFQSLLAVSSLSRVVDCWQEQQALLTGEPFPHIYFFIQS